MFGSFRSLAVTLCIASMGLYWARVVSLGPFSLEAFHVGMLFVMATTCFSRKSVVWMILYAERYSVWIIAYAGYLLFFMLAAVDTLGEPIWAQQVFFFVSAICLSAICSFHECAERRIRTGAALGLLGFVVFMEFSAKSAGVGTVQAALEFAAHGDVQALIYNFFRPSFNAFSSTGEALAFPATVTNSLAVSIFVLCLLMVATLVRTSPLLSYSVVCFGVGMSVLLDARSVAVAGAASVVGAVSIKMFSKGVSGRWWKLTAVVFCIVAGGLIVVSSAEDASKFFGDFSFQDESVGARYAQYEWAFGLINERVFTGNGFIENEESYPIHNLFLSSWAYTGITGFLFIVVFYLFLVGHWVRFCVRLVVRPSHWVLPINPEWVAVLPIIPFFRVWISGGGGHFAPGEWTAMAVYLALTFRNEVRQSLVLEVDSRSGDENQKTPGNREWPERV